MLKILKPIGVLSEGKKKKNFSIDKSRAFFTGFEVQSVSERGLTIVHEVYWSEGAKPYVAFVKFISPKRS